MTSLSLHHGQVFYGKAQALRDIDIELRSGEIVSLIGRNGAGKTTMLRALIGLLACSSGYRMLEGRDISSLLPYEINRLGIGYVPEDRQIFPNLTVLENLKVAGISHPDGSWTRDRIFAMFPRLLERCQAQGNTLSGGEQQMLSIARALMGNPRILLLDEPTEGLAPLVVESLVQVIVQLKNAGVGILLVEQNLAIPLAISDRLYVLDQGAIIWFGDKDAMHRDTSRINQLIAV